MKTILSLCDHSGTWSDPYREAGYEVIQLDLQSGHDVRLLKTFAQRVHGILAAPPCTMFCVAANHLWAKRTKEQMIEALSVVDACIRIVHAHKPAWWCLENPAGHLQGYLGTPTWQFHPCHYGDDYRKLTYLWGNFTPPMPMLPHAKGKSGAIENAKSVKGCRQNNRSITPIGFSRAFYEANP